MAKGDDVIQRYYNYLCSQGKTPNHSYEDFRTICQTPFLHLRRQMSTDSLPDIRFTFLGTFVVLPGMVIKMLQFTQDRKDKQLITDKQYERYIKLLTGHIKEHRQDFEKHKLKLERWKDYL
jgi:hypothetical protein